MQTLANVNTVANTSATFLASDTVYLDEGDNAVYTCRQPTWRLVNTLGNVLGNSVTLAHTFVYEDANMVSNITIANSAPATVTQTVSGNTVTFGNIRTVQDYLGCNCTVTLAPDAFGNYVHQGSVQDASSLETFNYEINVIIPDTPDLFPANLANIQYNFFTSNTNLADTNVVTSIGTITPRIEEQGQLPGGHSIRILMQDSANIARITSTYTTGITPSYLNSNGVANINIFATLPNLNGWLGNAAFTKIQSADGTSDIGRDVREITWQHLNPNGLVTSELTQKYYSYFDIGNVVTPVLRNRFFARNLWTNDYQNIEGLATIAYVGDELRTGNPHFAYAWATGTSNRYNITMYGVNSSSTELQYGPHYANIGNMTYTGILHGRVSSNVMNQTRPYASNVFDLVLSNSMSNIATWEIGSDAGDLRYVSGNVNLLSYTRRGVDFERQSGGTPPFTYDRLVARFQNGNTGYNAQMDWQYDVGPLPVGIMDATATSNSSAIMLTQAYNPQAGVGQGFGLGWVTRVSDQDPYPPNINPQFTSSIINNILGQRGTLYYSANAAGNSITMVRMSTFHDTANGYQESIHMYVGNTYRDTDLAGTVNSGCTGVHKVIGRNAAGTTYAGRLNSSNIILDQTYANINPCHYLLRGKTYTFENNISGGGYLYVTDSMLNGYSGSPANVLSNNDWLDGNYNVFGANITITPNDNTPDWITLTHTNFPTSQDGQYNRIQISGPKTTPNTRWDPVPGAIALIPDTTGRWYMFYTKYTGSATDQYRSAGLYYRILTQSGSTITFGTPVMLQDPAVTGNIYGITMAAQGTFRDGYLYAFGLIAGPDFANFNTYPWTARIAV